MPVVRGVVGPSTREVDVRVQGHLHSRTRERRLQQKEPVHINVATMVRATESSLQRAQAHEDLVISLQPNRLELETVVFVEPYRYHVLRV